MIDSYFRSHYQTIAINPILNRVIALNISPQTITTLALLLGVSIPFSLFFGYSLPALILLIASGYLDTLDGSLARALGNLSPQGAVLDIVFDRIVEFSIILGLFLVDPLSRGLICLMMLGSILICVSSFLVVGIFLENDSTKSFHYSPGIMERTEAFIFFALMIVFPTLFSLLACLFTLLVTITALIRIWQFRQNGHESTSCIPDKKGFPK